MIRHRSPRLKLKNHIVTQKEEEVPEGDNMVEGILFLEEEEEDADDVGDLIDGEIGDEEER